MNNNTAVIPIDHEAPRSKALLAAEQALFAHYGLDHQVHFVTLAKPRLRIRVLEAGSGPPLLLVPGGTGEALIFAALMAALPGRRFIVINRPGGGMSDGIDHRQIDLTALAVDTVRAVADAFDLTTVPVIANSMGGLWAFRYALAFPERVSAMVQMGCPALALGTSAPFFMRLLSVPLINELVVGGMQPQSIDKTLAGLRFLGSSREAIDRQPSVAAVAFFHAYNLPTYRESWKSLVGAVATITGARRRYALDAAALRRVTCPVQLIWGANDPFGGLEVARRMAQILPNAQLREMDVGHLPFIDQPEETGRVIRDFLTTFAPIAS